LSVAITAHPRVLFANTPFPPFPFDVFHPLGTFLVINQNGIDPSFKGLFIFWEALSSSLKVD
jgi:hypothetical protein